MCLLGVRIFNFHIFAYFSPKIVKIKPEIGNFKPKCWNMKYNFRNYETERRENLTQSWERKMQFSDAIWWRHYKSKMADGHHIENSFSAIFWRHIGRSTRNLEQRWRITCRYRSRDQNCNFRKFKMADGRHFEKALSPYLSRELSDFDQIWYTDTNFHSEHVNLTTKKNRNFSNSRWWTEAILKIVFFAIFCALLAD